MAVMTLTAACALAEIKVDGTTYTTLKDAANAAASKNLPVIISGEVNFNQSFSNLTVTFKAAEEGATLNIPGDNATPNFPGCNLTFEGFTMKRNNSDYGGIAALHSAKYINCNFVGQYINYAPDVTFTKCTFSQTADQYNIRTYNAKNVKFENCVFSASRKFVLVYHESATLETNAIFNDCSFIANEQYPANGKADRAAVESHPDWVEPGKKYTVTMNNCEIDCRLPGAFRDNHADGSYDTPSAGSVYKPANVTLAHIDDACGHPRNNGVGAAAAPSLPQTGDNSSLMFWSSLMILCAACIVMMSKKPASN